MGQSGQTALMSIIVHVIESERVWDQRLDEVKTFESLPEAQDYVTQFNAANSEDQVPDWYMFAKIVEIDGRPIL